MIDDRCERRPARALRRRSTGNLLRMGHCAPAVMQTLLDASGTDAPWLVKLAAGLPGGIGNTGGECGGITAPLMLLGLRHGLEPDEDVRCDFSRMGDVDRYIDRGSTARCEVLTRRVAQRVQVMIESATGR